MRQASIAAACQPDRGIEQAHLTDLLPMLPAITPSFSSPPQAASPAASCAVLGWARSGLMHLTGRPDGPPLAPHSPVLARAAIIADAITSLTASRGAPVRLDAPHLLAYRAQLQRWQRRGSTSANGTCRILRARDGWAAISLARPDDVRSVPAVLGRSPHAGTWAELARDAADRPAAEFAATAQLVGIPAAALGDSPPPPLRLHQLGRPGPAPRLALDLSAMWAGPLCARIVAQAGWQVLKVEDTRRPDGARSGPPEFYADLHAGIPAIRLDFGTASGRAELGRLAAQAGLVIESSRPRALRGLGMVAEDWLAGLPGRVWISVTGYGRADLGQRVAFGDDAAVAGGLVARESDCAPVFCGDAIADPLTGMLAGLAALAADADGGGWLVDVAMAGVCADLARPAGQREWEHIVSAGDAGWTVRHGDAAEGVQGW